MVIRQHTRGEKQEVIEKAVLALKSLHLFRMSRICVNVGGLVGLQI
jgi:hypothetical protein